MSESKLDILKSLGSSIEACKNVSIPNEYWDGSIDCIPTNDDLGIATINKSTANWSGRIDHFKVYQGKLYLHKIEVNFDPEVPYLTPSNVRREVLYRYENMIECRDGKEQIKVKEYRFEFLVYDELLIPFTGNLYIIYSEFDEWEIPSADNDDDNESEQIQLEFKDGILQ